MRVEDDSHARRRVEAAPLRVSGEVIMTDAECALRELVDAIDGNMERRIVYTKRPNERRLDTMVRARDILPAYERAKAALHRAEYSAGMAL